MDQGPESPQRAASPSAGDFEIAGLRVARGQRARGSIDLVELADGTRIGAPLQIIHGLRPGPVLYLGATIHGDEVAGIAILAKALSSIDPGTLRGTLIVVPVQHPLAFHADHRIALSQFLKSPLDQAPVDAWSCFPGNADGNLAERIADRLSGLIRRADYAIDIHTPTRGGRYVPIAILPPAVLGAAAAAARRLARQFGSGFLIQPTQGGYIADGVLCVEATRAGVPAFTFEIGEGGRLDQQTVDDGAICIGNALRGLEMIDGTPQQPLRSFEMRDFLGLRARRGGLLRTLAVLGETVVTGQPLAQITDIWGEVVETIAAPCDAVFVRATTLTTLSSGERAVTLGLL